ncbi:MAG: Rossmann-like domain-containing protein [Desulfonatronovibrio sp.]
MIITHSQILKSVISEALDRPDSKILSTFSGAHMVAVMSESGTGLCSKPPRFIQETPGSAPDHGDSAHSLAASLEHQNTVNASLGLAAINSLLNQDKPGQETKVQDLVRCLGKNKNVAIIGHFPFVEKMGRDFKNFWVLELSPGSMDLPEHMKQDILPRADLVAITATTLLNNTLGEIINLTRENAVKIMLGPSTPMASCLFDLGLDYLGGAFVQDPVLAVSGIEKDLPFRKMEGVRYVLTGKKHL